MTSAIDQYVNALPAQDTGRALGQLLLVEDDPAFVLVLGRALARRGYAVRTASSVDEAMAWLTAPGRRPDFAVLDLNVAGVSGLKLIAPIRACNERCRVVVLTGYASTATAVDAIKLGADQYFAKPIDVDSLVRALSGDFAPDAESTPMEALTVSRIEWEHLQRVLGENGGSVSSTARALKMHRRTLQRKLLRPPQST